MKIRELKSKIEDMKPEELAEELRDAKEELFNLRFQLTTGHLEDTSKIKEIKKKIARIKTIMRERELGIFELRRKPK